MPGRALGKKYTTKTPTRATTSPVNYSVSAGHETAAWLGTDLFKPGVKIRSSHEKHPPAQANNDQRRPNTALFAVSGIYVLKIALSLDSLDNPAASLDPPFFA